MKVSTIVFFITTGVLAQNVCPSSWSQSSGDNGWLFCCPGDLSVLGNMATCQSCVAVNPPCVPPCSNGAGSQTITTGGTCSTSVTQVSGPASTLIFFSSLLSATQAGSVSATASSASTPTAAGSGSTTTSTTSSVSKAGAPLVTAGPMLLAGALVMGMM